MVTKIDIARVIGVSRTCVSQVLNQTPTSRISDETRKRVIEVARELGYIHPGVPHGLGYSNQIAYGLCSDFARTHIAPGPWHFALLHATQRQAAAEDRTLCFIAASGDGPSISDMLRSIDLIRPRAVILDGTIPETLVQEIIARKIPCVITGVTPYATEDQWRDLVSTVSVDVNARIKILIDALIKRKAQTIGLIIGPTKLLINRMILKAYKETLAARQLRYDPALVQVHGNEADTQSIQRFRELEISIDGLICDATTAALVIQSLEIAPMPPLTPRNIAFFGGTEYISDSLRDLLSISTNVGDFAKAVNDQVSALVNHGPSRQKHIIIKPVVHEGS